MYFNGLSDIGLRRPVNQDSYQCMSIWGGSAVLLVVCDGMGGHKAGEVASKRAVASFCDKIVANPCYEEDPRKQATAVCRLMTVAANAANLLIYELSKRYEEYAGMGTTLVAAIIMGERMYVLNVGDSRAYIVTRREARQVTMDHSFVQYLLREHKITEEEAKYYPHKNVITRAIGIADTLETDFFLVNLTDWGTGYILLCSDGLTSYAENKDLISILCKTLPEDRADPNAELSRKTGDLIAFANSAGGGDNITAVLAKF